MSYRLACDLGDTIAAFATVAGGYPPFADCQATQPVPVVAFHGTADQVLPYAGKLPLLPVHDWAAGSAMPARITTCDIDATDVIWDFFAAHPQP